MVFMMPYDELNSPAVTFFENGDCSGFSGNYFAGPMGTVTSYTSSLMSSTGNAIPGRVSAVMVPFNVYLTLFSGGAFNGSTMIIDGANSKDQMIGREMECIYLGGFNELTNSFKIEHKTTGLAKGKWINVGLATGSVHADIEVGLSSTTTTTTSATITNTLTVETHEGILFEGMKMSE